MKRPSTNGASRRFHNEWLAPPPKKPSPPPDGPGDQPNVRTWGIAFADDAAIGESRRVRQWQVDVNTLSHGNAATFASGGTRFAPGGGAGFPAPNPTGANAIRLLLANNFGDVLALGFRVYLIVRPPAKLVTATSHRSIS